MTSCHALISKVCMWMPVQMFIFNPWHIYARVTVAALYACLSVCKLTATYNPGLYIENEVPLGFLWHSQGMNCVDFVENTAFFTS